MEYIAQAKDYWIAPQAVKITLNALGNPNRTQATVASGAVIMCYIKGVDGLEYDNGHQYHAWAISASPTYFNTATKKYVYAAIPRSSEVGVQAVIVYPSEMLDIYGCNEAGDQVGSEHFYYIWLQGVISESAYNRANREFLDMYEGINYGILATDEARDDQSYNTDWYTFNAVTQTVTFLKEIIMKAGSSFRNLILGGHNLTGVATGATPEDIDSDTLVVTPNYIRNKFLHKDRDDVTPYSLTIEQELRVGNRGIMNHLQSTDYTGDGMLDSGYKLWYEEGRAKLVIDDLVARGKFTVNELETRIWTYAGGNMVFSGAGSTIFFVEYLNANEQPLGYTYINQPWLLRGRALLAASLSWSKRRQIQRQLTDTERAQVVKFRCYEFSDDGTMQTRNWWQPNDIAVCETLNKVREKQTSDGNTSGTTSNTVYKRRIAGIGSKEIPMLNDGRVYDYVDLWNEYDLTTTEHYYTGTDGQSHLITDSVKGFLNTAPSGATPRTDWPAAGDVIVQMGNPLNTDRQAAVTIEVQGENFHGFKVYDTITDYSLTNDLWVEIGYDTTTKRAKINVFGDAYIGARDESTYVKYNRGDGTPQNPPRLDIKANVHLTSPTTHQDTTLNNFANAVVGDINDLQAQIDGEIDTWFYEGTPTLLNVPASEWTSDVEKDRHLGDLYYDIGTGATAGFAYRFVKIADEVAEGEPQTYTYSWQYLEDTAITEALAAAARAQDTADHKRRVFICDAINQTPTPPYDAGDLWVNVKYPWATGATYNDEILKCVKKVPRTEDGQEINTFNINDWSLANGYTAKYNSIINNEYYQQLTGGIISQNIRSATDAADAAQAAADAAQDAADAAQDDADAANTKLSNWADDGVISPTEKLALKNQKTDVSKEYLQIIADATRYSVSTASFTTAYNKAITAFDYYTSSSTENITIITDEEEDSDETPRYSRIAGYYSARQTILNLIAAAAKKYAKDAADAAAEAFKGDDVYVALKSALGSKTDIVGGLVLTSLIGMRQNTGTSESPIYTTWAGISGEYNAQAAGGGIAAWYGGDMYDKENPITVPEGDPEPRYAKSLFRFDGTGYLADGKIKWDSNGDGYVANGNVAWTTTNGVTTVTINGATVQNAPSVNTQQLLLNGVNITTVLSDILDMFEKDTTSEPGTTLIKAKYSLYSVGAISALGQGSGGGGGGGSTTLYGLNDVSENAAGTGVLGAQDGYVLTYNGTTNHWYAAPTAETYVLPVATSSALGGVKIGYTTDAANRNYAVQLSSEKMYVNVPWENTWRGITDSYSGTSSTTSLSQKGGNAIYNALLNGYASTAGDSDTLDSWHKYDILQTGYVCSDTANLSSYWAKAWTITVISKQYADQDVVMLIESAYFRRAAIVLVKIRQQGANNSGAYDFNFSVQKISGNIPTDLIRLAVNNSTGVCDLWINVEQRYGNYNITILKKNNNRYGHDCTALGTLTTSAFTTAQSVPALSSTCKQMEGMSQDVYDLNVGGTIYAEGNLCFQRNVAGIYITNQSISWHNNAFQYVSNLLKSTDGAHLGLMGDPDSNYTVKVNGSLKCTSINIGGYVISADTVNGGLHIENAGLYADTYISALGQGSGGGGGGQGDVTWALLKDNSDDRQIAVSHLTGLLNGSFSGKDYAVKKDANNKLYVNVPWANTTYGADNGVGLSGTTFYNSGVRATTINGNYLRVNTNGTNVDLTIPYATNAGTALVGNKLNVMATINGQNTTNYPWRLLAQSAEITTNYVDTEAVIVLRQFAVGGKTGTLKIAFRTNEIATTASGVSAVWLDRFGFNVDDIKIAVYWVANKSYADVFLKAVAWNRMEMHVIGNRSWTFVSSYEGTDGSSPVNAYASIEAAATALHGVAYTNIVSAQDGGIVSYANSAGAATKDSDGNAINSTYLKLAGGTMANTNLVTNLNADMLDGTHKSDLFTVFTNILSGDDANKTSITLGGTNKKLVINYATNANSAAKLTTVSKTAWGQTYWTANGVPDSISGNMSSVGDISFSASGKKIGGFLYFDTTNNRLGVGASSPSYKLHVAGTGYFTDNLTFANNKGIYMKDSDGEVNNVLYLSSSNQLILGSETANEGYNTYLRGGAVYLQYGGSNTGLLLNNSGNVGIGATSPSYKLHVSGDIYATGGVTSLSDIRKKNVIDYELPLTIEQIADAPTIRFTWKDGREDSEQVGTVAQYWQKVLPQVTRDKNDELSMQYGVAALVATITTARKVVDHEKRICELEKECERLKTENEQLRLKIA